MPKRSHADIAEDGVDPYKRQRAWCFTVNNYGTSDVTAMESLAKAARYLIYGKESGVKETPHLQGFVYFETVKNFYFVKRFLKRAHIEACRGSPEENITYCSKQNDFTEIGKRPRQGARVDLEDMKDSIMSGEKTVDEFAVEAPQSYHMYGRTLHKIEDIALRRKFRSWQTEGVWIWGPTGVGKSHEVFENYDPTTTYNFPNDGGWWDGYTGQETVIFNEFRGDLPYAKMLTLVDKWPELVRRRCREPVPFLAKKIFVTSSMPPEKVYHNIAAADCMGQLYRRFKVFHKASRDSPLVAWERPAPALHDDEHYMHARR